MARVTIALLSVSSFSVCQLPRSHLPQSVSRSVTRDRLVSNYLSQYGTDDVMLLGDIVDSDETRSVDGGRVVAQHTHTFATLHTADPD